jgi:uncharacterized SAM-binding protein YcdF (DUF218 family)
MPWPELARGAASSGKRELPPDAPLPSDTIKLSSESAPAAAPGNPRWLRRLFWLLGLCALVLVLALFREEILSGLARGWIVNQPPAKPGAIVVLAGKVEARPFAVARLYREGKAPAVVVTVAELTPTARLGLAKPEIAVTCEALVKQGVPADAIQIVGTNLASLAAEAEAVVGWARKAGVHSLLVPTDPFNTRRARRAFRQAAGTANLEIGVVPIEMRGYRPSEWWRHEEGWIDFENEITRFVLEWFHR